MANNIDMNRERKVDGQMSMDPLADLSYVAANHLLGIRVQSIPWSKQLSSMNNGRPSFDIQSQDLSSDRSQMTSFKTNEAVGETMKSSSDTKLDVIMKNSSTPTAASNASKSFDNNWGGHVSVGRLYEPKFLQVYDIYAQVENIQGVDFEDHLLNICLDLLVSFCCWARSSSNNSNLIRRLLDDNADLRPEVRNGLALILVYVVSAAKARHIKSDMFSVLHDVSNGLGIVNKTSLKIYNDPFSYFIFIKGCISGLIDAGIVPENERINQPKKEKGRYLENKDELAAFLQMKATISLLLSTRQSLDVSARVRIQTVVNVWLQRNKNIRTHRFATALVILSAPQAELSPLMALSFPVTPCLTGNPVDASTIPLSATDDEGKHISSMFIRDNLTKQASLITDKMKRPGSFDIIDNTAYPKTGDKDTRKIVSKDCFPPMIFESVTNTAGTAMLPSTLVPKLSPGISPLQAGITNSSQDYDGRDSLDIQPRKFQRIAEASGSIPNSLTVSNGDSMENIEGPVSLPQSLEAYLKSGAIPAIRFERVDINEWEMFEISIFNISSFLQNSISGISSFNVVYLIDENCITPDEMSKSTFKSSSPGFASLQVEMKSRGGLLTSWPVSEYSQLKSMLDVLLAVQKYQDTNNQFLSSLWGGIVGTTNIGSTPIDPNAKCISNEREMTAATGSNNNSMPTATKLPRGMLVYEVLSHIGIVLRTIPTWGFDSKPSDSNPIDSSVIAPQMSDCWRLFYPNDLSSSKFSTLQFGEYLTTIFPQIRSKLHVAPKQEPQNLPTSHPSTNSAATIDPANSSCWDRIVIKYCPHKSNQPWTKPPSQETSESYQTIGALTDITSVIFSRLDPLATFHDFMLHFA